MCPSSVRAYEREVREGGKPIRMHECRGKRDAHALVGAASRGISKAVMREMT